MTRTTKRTRTRRGPGLDVGTRLVATGDGRVRARRPRADAARPLVGIVVGRGEAEGTVRVARMSMQLDGGPDVTDLVAAEPLAPELVAKGPPVSTLKVRMGRVPVLTAADPGPKAVVATVPLGEGLAPADVVRRVGYEDTYDAVHPDGVCRHEGCKHVGGRVYCPVTVARMDLIRARMVPDVETYTLKAREAMTPSVPEAPVGVLDDTPLDVRTPSDEFLKWVREELDTYEMAAEDTPRMARRKLLEALREFVELERLDAARRDRQHRLRAVPAPPAVDTLAATVTTQLVAALRPLFDELRASVAGTVRAGRRRKGAR